MTTGIPSGLGVTVGWAIETTPGTFVTPARWLPHLKAEMKWKKKIAQGEVLHANRFLLAERRQMVSHTVDGTAQFTAVDKQLGVFFKCGLGCKTPSIAEISSTGVYKQIYRAGPVEGLTLSCQKGIPQLHGSYTVQAFSYNGLKVLTWELSVARTKIGVFDLTLDGWNEVVTVDLTAASYLSGTSMPNILTFAEGALLIGGTVTTTDTVLSVTSNAAPVGLVSSVSVKMDNKVTQSRFPLGSKTKKEQISNGFGSVSGTVEIEFANKTDFYTAFKTDTPLALQFSLTGPKVGTSGTNHSAITVIIPEIFWEGTTPNETGPEIIKVKVPFTGLLSNSVSTPLQLTYVTTTEAA